MITTGQVHVAGEVTTQTYVDIPGIIRDKILEIGYDSSAKGYDGASCGVSVSIGAQSPDIAQGVDDAYEQREGEGTDDFDRQGAGDQGLMFGYACRETPELMPLPIMLAHQLAKQLSTVRRNGIVPYLRPDGKTQVTIEYAGITPVRLDTVVVSTQHAPDIDLNELLAPDIRDYVVDPVLDGPRAGHGQLPAAGQSHRPIRDRRPDGRRRPDRPEDHHRYLWRHGQARRRGLLRQGPVQGGPQRRLRDALGGQERRRGRAGRPVRDAGRVRDRQGQAGRLFVECFGTEQVPVERIQDAVLEVFDLRPRAIISVLDLLRPIYSQTAAFGHFGRAEPDFSWERADRVEQLRSAAGLEPAPATKPRDQACRTRSGGLPRAPACLPGGTAAGGAAHPRYLG